MAKKTYAIFIIVLIVIGKFFREKIMFEGVNLFAVIYFLLLAVLGVLFIREFQPVKRNSFYTYLSVFILFSITIATYFALKS